MFLVGFMGKILLFSFGTISLGFGIIGIFIPGLPSTPFFILSASCYLKSSKRFYNWLINNPIFGKDVKRYLEKGSLALKTKIKAIIIIITMLSFSLILVSKLLIKIIILIAGVIGIFVLLRIKTEKC